MPEETENQPASGKRIDPTNLGIVVIGSVAALAIIAGVWSYMQPTPEASPPSNSTSTAASSLAPAYTPVSKAVDSRAGNPLNNTPLMEAVMAGRTDEVKSLIAAGADINARDNNGQTPLMLSIMNRRAESTRILLAAGADPEIKDNKGCDSPCKVQWFDSDNKALLKLLKQSQAQRAANAKAAQSTVTDYNGPNPDKPDFVLGDNLSDEELQAISDRVQAQKAARGLSDLQTMQLMNSEVHKASVQKYKATHRR